MLLTRGNRIDVDDGGGGTSQPASSASSTTQATTTPTAQARGNQHVVQVNDGGGYGGATAQSEQPFRNPLALGGPNPNAAAARNNVNALNREVAQLSNNPSFGSRVGNTVLGGAGRSLASDVNSVASAYDLTQGARNRMMNEYLADYEHGLERARNDLRQMEESNASARDAEHQRMIVNDWQRKVDAMKEAIATQPKATQATYGLADDIKSSADASIENAKRGLDRFGRLVVDTGAKMTQMGTDAAKSWYLLNRFNVNSGAEDFVKRLPLAGRIYGENTQTAREEGADARSAAVYGAASAIVKTSQKQNLMISARV